MLPLAFRLFIFTHANQNAAYDFLCVDTDHMDLTIVCQFSNFESSLPRTVEFSATAAEFAENLQNKLFAVVGVELSEKPGYMRANCWKADFQPYSDLFVG